MSVGLLTGRPAEEMPGSMGDLLPELLQLHERVRQAMQSVIQAVWPSLSVPEGLGELTKKNTQLSQELEECKAQLEAALAASENAKETPSGNICFER